MNNQETMELAELIEYYLDVDTPDILSAAIAEAITTQYLLIDRAELPDVVDDPGDAYFRVGVLGVMNDADPATYRRIALDNLAAAEHLERRNTVEAKREKRRDKVAMEIAEATYGAGPAPTPYSALSKSMQTAIDRIIDLAEKLEDGTP